MPLGMLEDIRLCWFPPCRPCTTLGGLAPLSVPSPGRAKPKRVCSSPRMIDDGPPPPRVTKWAQRQLPTSCQSCCLTTLGPEKGYKPRSCFVLTHQSEVDGKREISATWHQCCNLRRLAQYYCRCWWKGKTAPLQSETDPGPLLASVD